MCLLLFWLSFAMIPYCARTRNLTLRTNTPALLSKSIDYRAVVGWHDPFTYDVCGINHGALPTAPQFLYGLDTFHAIYINVDMICIRHINKFYVTNAEQTLLGNWLSPKYRNKIAAGVGSIALSMFRSRNRRIYTMNTPALICWGGCYIVGRPCQWLIKLRTSIVHIGS